MTIAPARKSPLAGGLGFEHNHMGTGLRDQSTTQTPVVGVFEGHSVRVIHADGMEWFAARDVALALGYADPTTAIRSHCKREVQKMHPTPDSTGRVQEVLYLPESDVLRLVVKSRLPAAERFERWIFSEVIPTIRRTGSYGHGQPDARAVLDDPHALRRLLLSYTERVTTLEATVEAQAPKVAALDRLAGVDGSLAITDAAKALKLAPRALFKFLHGAGWIYRRAGRVGWLAYQPRMQAGLLEHKVATITVPHRLDEYGRRIERVTEQVRVTLKGLTRLAELAAQGAIHGY